MVRDGEASSTPGGSIDLLDVKYEDSSQDSSLLQPPTPTPGGGPRCWKPEELFESCRLMVEMTTSKQISESTCDKAYFGLNKAYPTLNKAYSALNQAYLTLN